MPTREEILAEAEAKIAAEREAALASEAEVKSATSASIKAIRDNVAAIVPIDDASDWPTMCCYYLDMALDFLEFGRELSASEKRMLMNVAELTDAATVAALREKMRLR